MTTLTFSHPDNLSVRFRQLACDPLPKWAVEVRDGTYTDQVLRGLGDIETHELPYVLNAIAGLEEKKWFVAEAVSYLQWLEHVNPTVEEDVALRNMKRVRTMVEQRQAA